MHKKTVKQDLWGGTKHSIIGIAAGFLLTVFVMVLLPLKVNATNIIDTDYVVGPLGGNVSFTEDTTITGDLTVSSHTLNINNCLVTVKGDVLIHGGDLNINQLSNLKVEGSVLLDGGVLVVGAEATLDVKGSLIVQAEDASHNPKITDGGITLNRTGVINVGGDYLYNCKESWGRAREGILNLKGDYYSNKGWIGTVNLVGENVQKITLEEDQKINVLKSNKPEVKFDKYLNVTMDNSIVATTDKDALYVTKQLVLNGNSLEVKGNLIVKGEVKTGDGGIFKSTGDVTVVDDGIIVVDSNSTLETNGSLIVQSKDNGGKITASRGGITLNGTGVINVDGDYLYNCTESWGRSREGTLNLKGNYYSNKGWAGTVKMLSNAATIETEQDIKISTLVLSAGKSHYTFPQGDCYYNLIATSLVTFDPNGGTVDPSTKNVTTKQTYGDLPLAVKEGCKLVGWVENGSEIFISADTVVEAVDDHTLCAVWAEADPSSVVMLRLYNPNSGEHFYTKSEREKKKLVESGWTFEGEGWTAPTSGDPVYRLYNKNNGDHHYTTSEREKNKLVEVGWTDEGIGWYSAPKETGKPLYRLYNPNCTGAGSHHYTTSEREKKKLIAAGWQDEDVAWYAIAD